MSEWWLRTLDIHIVVCPVAFSSFLTSPFRFEWASFPPLISPSLYVTLIQPLSPSQNHNVNTSCPDIFDHCEKADISFHNRRSELIFHITFWFPFFKLPPTLPSQTISSSPHLNRPSSSLALLQLVIDLSYLDDVPNYNFPSNSHRNQSISKHLGPNSTDLSLHPHPLHLFPLILLV